MEHSPAIFSSGPLEGPHLLHTVVLGAAYQQPGLCPGTPLPRVSLFVGFQPSLCQSPLSSTFWQRYPGGALWDCVCLKILFSSFHYISNGSRIPGWKPVFIWVLDALLHLSSSVRWSSWEREHHSPSSPCLRPLLLWELLLAVLDLRCDRLWNVTLVPVHAVMPLTHWHHKWFQTPSTQAIGLLFNSL